MGRIVTTASLVAALAVLAGAGSAGAAVVNVPCDAGALQAAIADANTTAAPDTLNLAAGCTYSPATGVPPIFDTAFGTVVGTLTINGNGAVLRPTDACLYSIFARKGAISAIGPCIAPALAVGVSFTSGEVGRAGSLSLDRVTIRDWRSTKGAVVVRDGSSLQLSRSTLSDNASLFTDSNGNGLGVGALLNRGTVTIAETTFARNNAAFGNGPGRCRVIGPGACANTDPAGAGEGGGAIGNDGTMSITDSVFEDNFAGNGSSGDVNIGEGRHGENGGNGGAIRNGFKLTVVRTVFRNNRAGDGGEGHFNGDGGDGGSGGAIFNSGTLLLRDSLLAGNWAGDAADASNDGAIRPKPYGDGGDAGGGGAIATVGTATIVGTTFRDNVGGAAGAGVRLLLFNLGDDGAPSSGGAISSRPGSGGALSLTNSTLFHNNARFGNAIFSAGPATITAATIVGNMLQPGDPGESFFVPLPFNGIPTPNSLSEGGGIWLESPATIRQTLLAANGPRNCAGSHVLTTPPGAFLGVWSLPDFVDGGGNASLFETGVKWIPLFGGFAESKQLPTCPASFAGSYRVTQSAVALGLGDPEVNLLERDQEGPMTPLQDNGGPTPTIMPLPGHPAIDAAACAAGSRRTSGAAPDRSVPAATSAPSSAAQTPWPRTRKSR